MTGQEGVTISAQGMRADVMTTKSEKKSETIEVRMAYSQKQTFMETCKRNGKNASNVIREYVDAYVAPKSTPNGFGLFKKWILIPVGMIALLVMAIVVGVVSLTFSPETNDSIFTSLDTNSDGMISQADINQENLVPVTQFLQWADVDADGIVSRDEFSNVKTFNAANLGIGHLSTDNDGEATKVFSVEMGLGDKKE